MSETFQIKKLLLTGIAALSVLTASAAHADPINLPSTMLGIQGGGRDTANLCP
jgi:hypothetical protein